MPTSTIPHCSICGDTTHDVRRIPTDHLGYCTDICSWCREAYGHPQFRNWPKTIELGHYDLIPTWAWGNGQPAPKNRSTGPWRASEGILASALDSDELWEKDGSLREGWSIVVQETNSGSPYGGYDDSEGWTQEDELAFWAAYEDEQDVLYHAQLDKD